MKIKILALGFLLASLKVHADIVPMSQSVTTLPKENVELIIFIHGTIKPPQLSFSSLFKIINDDVDNTIYSYATGHLRNDSFFYRGQPIQELGLKPIVIDTENIISTAQTIADLYNFQYKLQEKNPVKKLYYTYGWNGLLSKTKRFEASQRLYYELQEEIVRLKSHNLNPTITLITYSHGGNVALYLPTIQGESENSTFALTIDKLIMLACPIQKETDYLVTDAMFNKVYNLYSTEDFVQQWDFISNHEQFFSQRIFKNRRTFTVPPKVVQVRIRVTKKTRCIREEKIKNNIHILTTLPARCFEHRDPGHMEMGGFSWGNYWYRDIFPLYPMPIIALVPTIINGINATLPTSTNLTFDFIPHYNAALLSDNFSKHKAVKTLWSPEERMKMWENVSTNVPLDYTFYNQEEHITKALLKARNELLATKDGRKYRRPHNKTLARLLNKIDKKNSKPLILAHRKRIFKKFYRQA